MGTLLVDFLVVGSISVVFVIVFATFSSRILGTRIGFFRLLLAGAAGLGAVIGFESQFVWEEETYNFALLPLQIGIVFFVAIAFLVLSELMVPQGTLPRINEILPHLRARISRARRYTQVTRIAFRHRLIPFKPNTDPTNSGISERKRQGRALRLAIENAGGGFIKLGQMLSTRTDLLPQEFLDELSQLQQHVPAEPWHKIQHSLEYELRGPITSFFQSFEETPFAAASIGQVHRATLLNGQQVAVKVQRPGIIPLVERDLEIVLRLAKRLERTAQWATDLGIGALARGFADNIRVELDYSVEARNMSTMALSQAKHSEHERVNIPHFYPELSTSKILVMEFIPGDTLSDSKALAQRSIQDRQRAADRLLKSTLTQIIDDGIFHADLHPGNIILTPRNKIVLLDFGSIGHLDNHLRSQIGDVLMAFYRNDAVTFTDALFNFVDVPDELDESSLRRQIGVFLATRLSPGMAVDVTMFSEMVQLLAENRIAVPTELGSAFRAMATLEGTLRILYPSYDLLTAASDFAKDRVKKASSPKAVFETVSDELLSLVPLAKRFPRRIDQITSSLADGRLNVNIRLFADRRDRKFIQNFVYLLATTLLASAFSVVAAMLLVSESGPQITPTLSLYQLFGYLLVTITGVLTLRVVLDIFRRPQRE